MYIYTDRDRSLRVTTPLHLDGELGGVWKNLSVGGRGNFNHSKFINNINYLVWYSSDYCTYC